MAQCRAHRYRQRAKSKQRRRSRTRAGSSATKQARRLGPTSWKAAGVDDAAPAVALGVAFHGLRVYYRRIVLELIRSDRDDDLAEHGLAMAFGQKRFEMAKAEKVFSDALRVDLYAGYSVKDFASARAWYERLLGCPPTFLPEDGEAVWELAEYRYVFIKVRPEHAGHAFNLFFLSDLDGFIAQIAERGLHPTKRETLSNGVRRVIFHDPDGNEIWFGGAPPKS